MFSKTCKYGIKATIYIASRSSKQNRVGIKNIAESIDSPAAFTAKILQNLVKKDILNSVKGPNGGFYICEEKIKTLTLAEIVDAIDGDSLYVECGLGLKKCSAQNPCPIHYRFLPVRREMKKLLEETHITDLITGVIKENTFLKIIED